MLYLLQGIDGRFIRFAINPAKEQNPYKSAKAKSADGAGFALGRNGYPEEQGDEGEVVGIDIDIDEAKACLKPLL